jgi:protein-S-isoprenylcysteine O-methyltransferase Ste14
MISSSDPPSKLMSSKIRSGILVRFIQIAVVFVIQGCVLFLSAGQIDWSWAWLYFGICLCSLSVNSYFMLKYHPDTIAERGHPKDVKRWDKVVSGLWSLFLFLLIPLVAGLDKRFQWTGQADLLHNIGGAIALAIGLAFSGWAMISNAYFSTVVRIQEEREHTVCQSGPYRFVRHPGYLGFSVQSLATPLILGSLWALLPASGAVVLMVIRTHLEDHFLRSNLSGYLDYIRKVRYRLVPGLW